jgi:hypothetical protein
MNIGQVSVNVAVANWVALYGSNTIWMSEWWRQLSGVRNVSLLFLDSKCMNFLRDYLEEELL